MTVTQFNIWRCDRCPRVEVVRVETASWQDPVVVPPPGWVSATVTHDGDLCPACAAQQREETER